MNKKGQENTKGTEAGVHTEGAGVASLLRVHALTVPQTKLVSASHLHFTGQVS